MKTSEMVFLKAVSPTKSAKSGDTIPNSRTHGIRYGVPGFADLRISARISDLDFAQVNEALLRPDRRQIRSASRHCQCTNGTSIKKDGLFQQQDDGFAFAGCLGRRRYGAFSRSGEPCSDWSLAQGGATTSCRFFGMLAVTQSAVGKEIPFLASLPS